MEKKDFSIEDYIMILVILSPGAGNLGILPMNLYQIFLLLLGVIIIINRIRNNRRIYISKKIIYIIGYMWLITVAFSRISDSIRGMLFFSIEVIIILLYYCSMTSVEKLTSVIWMAGVVLSIWGLVQFVAMNMGISAIYDLSRYGFVINGDIGSRTYGLCRVYSLYSEPAQLSAVLSGTFGIGWIKYKNTGDSRCKISNIIVLLCIVLTLSVVVYVSTIVVCLLLGYEFNKSIIKRVWILLVLLFIASIIAKTTMGRVMLNKVELMLSDSSTMSGNLSGFAVTSNFRIALAKIRDGMVLGTGFNSHKSYYSKYIGELYSRVYLQLNANDAASLFIRIMSEFGIPGVFFCMSEAIRRIRETHLEKNYEEELLCVLFYIAGMRNGHYEDVIIIICFCVLVAKVRKIYFARVEQYE